MKANSTHISLETAKLFKCNCDSIRREKKYIETNQCGEDFEFEVLSEEEICELDVETGEFYPCFSWQEILWEHTEEFFGCDIENAEILLKLLQEKKYEEADLCFRKHCILIKNQEV